MTLEQCGCNVTSSFYNGPRTVAFAASKTCSNSAFIAFMTIIETLILKSCRINDPCGRVVPKTVPDEEYDFIVIGGGSGGSVVTGRLAEVKNWKILLIEAGHDEPAWSQVPGFQCYSYGSEIDWKFKTEPEKNACFGSKDRKCDWPRGKVLGGSAVLNAMMYVRAAKKDAERWVEAGNTNFTYEELIRLYKKSEDNLNIGQPGIDEKYHAKGGPWTIQYFNDHLQNFSFNIFQAAKEAGFSVRDDLNGDVSYGFAPYQSNTRNGMRLSQAKAFLRTHRNNTNLHVMLNSTASKILITEENNERKAYGVELIYNDKTYRVRAKKEVILAAGSVKTPQLLLLSGIGPKDELDKFNIEQVHNLPGVGKGVQDHPCLHITYQTNQNDTFLTWNDVDTYLETGYGPLSALRNEDIFARLSSSYTTEDDPDGQFLFFPSDWCNPPRLKTIPIVILLNQPRSRGYIGLKSRNIFDHPKIVANYFKEEIDMKIMVEHIRKALKLFAQPSLQDELGLVLKPEGYYKICSKKFGFDSDDFWACIAKYGTKTMFHPCSSCRMGPSSNPDACVNQEFQVYGLENVRITDASVFPSIIATNIQATVVALAEKAAEIIKIKYN